MSALLPYDQLVQDVEALSLKHPDGVFLVAAWIPGSDRVYTIGRGREDILWQAFRFLSADFFAHVGGEDGDEDGRS